MFEGAGNVGPVSVDEMSLSFYMAMGWDMLMSVNMTMGLDDGSDVNIA